MDKSDKTYDKYWEDLYDTSIDTSLIENVLVREGREIDEENHRESQKSRKKKEVFSCKEVFAEFFCEKGNYKDKREEKWKQIIVPFLKKCDIKRVEYFCMKREFCGCHRSVTIPESETIRNLKDDKGKIYDDCSEEYFHIGFPLFLEFGAEEEKYTKREKSCCHIDDQSLTFRIAEYAKKDGRNNPRYFPTEKKEDS